jgi:uncharacterized membrane protein YraQ (UPF0718 family)
MSDNHCHNQNSASADNDESSCHSSPGKPDWLLRISLTAVVVLYSLHLLLPDLLSTLNWLMELGHSVFELINTIWWGVLIGILMISALGRVPREFVMAALGTGKGFAGIWRATLAGVLLDLCSHGILMVGAKLYERGASTGQVMAFLIASPWNSFSLTLILIALIGLPWTLAFIVLSMAIALLTGALFERLVAAGTLPANPNEPNLPEDFEFWREAKAGIANSQFSFTSVKSALMDGLVESKMVIRWILFGVLLASLIRAFVSPEQFESFFGPSLLGLVITLSVATIIEVCSEGSTPIAADILNRAGAPGNSFVFLMGGVATDYTEIVVLKDTTKSLKTAMFLPLLTVPQIVLLGWLINIVAT